MGLAFTACESDPSGGGGGGGGTATGPTLLVLTETGFVSGSATVNQGESFTVKIQGEKGDANLQAITIYENGTAIDFSRILDGGNAVGANPFLIVGGDELNFTKEITIIAHNTEATSTYEIELRALDGTTDSETVSITTLTADPPVISLGGTEMYMADPSTIVSIPVTVTGVTKPLLVIGVFDSNGDPIDANRLWWNDISNGNWPVNPGAVEGSDQFGFSATLFIRAQSSGTEEYTIGISDADDLYSKTFTINVNITTPVTTLMGVLFNRSGPAGTGGLDLDNGMSTGSNSAEAELIDEGIDISLPDATNWIRKIKGAADTEVKELKPNEGGLLESFTFASVDSKEQVAALWDNGLVFTDMNGAGELRSDVVEVGDMFVVSKAGNFYIVRVTEVNENPNDNSDNYVMDIKF